MTQEQLQSALEKLYTDSAVVEKNRDLLDRALTETQLTYLPKADALQKNARAQTDRIETQKAEVNSQSRKAESELRNLFNEERQRLSNQSLQRGLAHSSIAMNVQENAGTREQKALRELWDATYAKTTALSGEANSLLAEMENALLSNDYQRALDTRARFDKLVGERAEQEFAQSQFTYKQEQDARTMEQAQRQFESKMEADALALAQNQNQFEAKQALSQDQFNATQALSQNQFDAKLALSQDQFTAKLEAEARALAQNQTQFEARQSQDQQQFDAKAAATATAAAAQAAAKSQKSASGSSAQSAAALLQIQIDQVVQTLEQSIPKSDKAALRDLYKRLASDEYVGLIGKDNCKALQQQIVTAMGTAQ